MSLKFDSRLLTKCIMIFCIRSVYVTISQPFLIYFLGNLPARYEEIFRHNPIFRGVNFPEVKSFDPFDRRYPRFSKYSRDFIKVSVSLKFRRLISWLEPLFSRPSFSSASASVFFSSPSHFTIFCHNLSFLANPLLFISYSLLQSFLKTALPSTIDTKLPPPLHKLSRTS